MTSWEMQIKVRKWCDLKKRYVHVFRSVHPTSPGNVPYRYDNAGNATKSLRSLYPDAAPIDMRVVEVDHPPNM